MTTENKNFLSPVLEASAGLLKCFIGSEVDFSGTIDFQGTMHLEGAFSGLITSADGTLRISELSEIDASIDVAVAQIHGTVKGDISARDAVVLKRTAIVRADIHTPSLVIEDGAIFEGRCRMSNEPSAQQAVRRKLKQVALQT